MRVWSGRVGLALALGLTAGSASTAGSALAAGKPRDACFGDDGTPEQTIAGCNLVLGQRKRETTTSVAHAFYNRGLAYKKKEDYDRAIADFNEAIAVDPSDADFFRSRGSTYDDMERYDAAIEDYDRSIKLDPTVGDSFVNRGIAYGNKGDFERAIKDFDEAIRLDPKRGLTYYSRALAYEKTGAADKALADVETAFRLEPEDEDVQAVRKRLRSVVAARPAPAVAASPAAPATGAATYAEFDAQQAATAAIWSRLPFGARRAMFVTRKANSFGDYEARPSSVFAPGEKLLTYLEPIGYAFTPVGADTYRFGVTVDVEIVSASGEILGGQKAILKQDFTSHFKNQEFFLNSTMSLDGAPAGAYVLAYTLREDGGDRTVRVEQPFTIGQ
ncbi:tetratricopeptide repeat protein [Methylobacterium sp. Leaf399]|uniref:tetratricopeptide repeat protein n=1 Tax=Methylobacterium sp. Leaf399 TaxID=1736364 RepID=UPI0009EB2C70|nr:tetratricopeptide repeat protein [Methylobacterium sp. Leaf399]